MTTSMGKIYDRSLEHLGTTDAMVIRVRRRLIAGGEARARPNAEERERRIGHRDAIDLHRSNDAPTKSPNHPDEVMIVL